MIKIPGFEIKKQLYGSDTYAVFRGVREKDGQRVILKMQQGENVSVEFYQHEYDILQALDGDGIVKAVDLITHEGVPIIIYDDIGAESLDDLMGSTQFSMAEQLEIAIGITSALEQVHNAGYLHKCINPSNILYHKATSRIQLINFELAIELISDQMVSDGSEVTSKTMAYIAPEQTGRLNRSLDYRSDLYSLGVTLYELFSGKVPFESTDPLELIHSHIAKIPVSPNAADPQVPEVLSDIVMKLVAKEASQRYQGAAGLKYDLNVCLTQFEEMGYIRSFTLQEHDISDQFRISGKLYGREEETSTLMAAFARVERGSREQVLVTGYAGIGKTALVREVLQQYISGKAQVTLHFGIGRFDRFHRDIPYNAIVQAAKDVIRQILAKSDSELEIWREKLAKALGRSGRVIADLIPEIEIILGPQPSVPKLGPLEARNRLHLVFQNFVRALSGSSHPLVIFVDDLQYADAASLKLIETILIDKGLHYFLGISAYRDN
ncbi:MAG: serine/threonine-protein kinase PknK, partial [Deltaproteobacteria bacterium]